MPHHYVVIPPTQRLRSGVTRLMWILIMKFPLYGTQLHKNLLSPGG